MISVSKQGVFSVEKFNELWAQHDQKKEYNVLDALRNRIDDEMCPQILKQIANQPIHTFVLVSVLTLFDFRRVMK